MFSTNPAIPATRDMDGENMLDDILIDNSDTRTSRRTREIYIGTPDTPRREKEQGDPDKMDDDRGVRRGDVETEEDAGKRCQSQDHQTISQISN